MDGLLGRKGGIKPDQSVSYEYEYMCSSNIVVQVKQ
jgi:hypothetical protein